MKQKIALAAVSLAAVVGAATLIVPLHHEQKPGVATPSAVAEKQLLDRTSNAFYEIARNSTPAVVSISVIKKIDDPTQLSGMMDVPVDPSGRALGLGSGVIIGSDGYIVTNNHVVESAEKITVTLDEKKKYDAEVVGTDPKTDLAVIRLEPPKKGEERKALPVMKFGDSSDIRVGDWAIAIGSPFGLNRSVSSGIVSAKGRGQMGILDIEDFIQTDAAINPGSSGGPLLNAQGEMIGINTAIFTQGGGFMGIGFAIPAEIAHEVSEQLISQGYVTRGWMGVSAQDLDPDLASYFGMPKSSDTITGALISDVSEGGPASEAKLEAGDVVLKYDDQKIESSSQLKGLVGKTSIGKRVDLDILRSGKPTKLRVTILQQPGADGVRPGQFAGKAAAGKKKTGHYPGLGMTVEDVPGEILQFLGIHDRSKAGAIVVDVAPGSPAFDSGMAPGDIVLKFGKADVGGARQLRQLARQLPPGEVSVLYVQRGPHERIFVPLRNVG